jgi:hypothetical protein
MIGLCLKGGMTDDNGLDKDDGRKMLPRASRLTSRNN